MIRNKYFNIFYKVITPLKKQLRALLYVIVCSQLCVAPIYAYPQDANNQKANDVEGIIKDLQEIDNSMQDREAASVFEEMQPFIEALEEGKVLDYLREHPEIREKMDLFLIADQRVESISHQLDPRTNTMVESVSNTMELNGKKTRSVHVVSESVQVKYDSSSKELVFESVVNDRVVLRQYIPNMDVIDYVHDNDILVLLDRKKGLLLADMTFARTYLGSAPLPVTEVLVPILEHMDTKLPANAIRKIDIEFIDRTTQLPDTLPEGVRDKYTNFLDKTVFFAGDLLISYTDQDGNKHMVQFLKRSEIAFLINNTYKKISLMVGGISNNFQSSLEDLKKRAKEKRETREPTTTEQEQENAVLRDGNTLLRYNISALFTKEALHKLTQAGEAIQARMQQLEALPPRDAIVFEEWKENFNKVIPQISEWKESFENLPTGKRAGEVENKTVNQFLRQSRDQAENPAMEDLFTDLIDKSRVGKDLSDKLQQSPEEREAKGSVFTTEDMFVLDQKPFSVEAAGALRKLAGFTKASGKAIDKGWSFVKKNNIETFVYMASAVVLFSFITKKASYMDGAAFYSATSLPNIVALMMLLPVLFITIAVITRGPYLRLFNKSGELTEWKNMNIPTKVVSTGYKFVSKAIYPFWHYIAKAVGQPHFFPALQKGLNPFRNIVPSSDIGEIAGIKKSTHLGVQLPQYSKDSESFHQMRQLQNTAVAKKYRQETLAWLMAVIALTQSKNVDPVQAVIFGSNILNWEKVVEGYGDISSRIKIMWVMKHLLKEIKKLGEIDMRKELAELEPEMIVRYYKRTQALAADIESKSDRSKRWKWRVRLYKTMQFLKNRTVLGHVSSFQQIMLINEAVSNGLRENNPNQYQTQRVTREFVGDHIPVVLVPIMSTDRAQLSFEHFEKTALNANGTFLSGGPHIQEVGMNTVAHFFIVSAQTGMVFGDKRKVIQKNYDTVNDNYHPSEYYSEPVRGTQQPVSDYLKHAFFDYLFKTKGKPGSFGEIMWSRYKARFLSLQMTLLLLTSLRWVVTESTFTESFMGALFFHLAGYWLFGFPWDIIVGGSNLNKTRLEGNKERLRKLHLSLSRVSDGIVGDKESFFKEYKTSLKEVLTLYSFLVPSEEDLELKKRKGKQKGFFRTKLIDSVQEVNPDLRNYLVDFDPEKELPISEDIKQMQDTARELKRILLESPPLHTEYSHSADRVLTYLFGGVLSTFLAVHWLSVLSFDKDYLNWGNIGLWTLANFAGIFIIYQIWAEGYYYKWFMGTKPGRGVSKGLGFLKRGWTEHFSNRILNMRGASRGACERGFSSRNTNQ